MDIKEIVKKKHINDEDQLKFIFSNDNRILVTAPAGCGKTTAMVSKIALELENGNISNNKRILAMTFSVNAALKIKDSLRDLLPELVDNSNFLKRVDVANYHNFAMKLLFKHGYAINSELMNLSEFKILNDSSNEMNDFLSNEEVLLMKEMDKSIKLMNIQRAKSLIKDYKNIFMDKLFPKKIITYNAILVFARELLVKEEQIKNFYQSFYKLIIIDEFQDTNYLALSFIETLIGENKIIVLGDEMQKIYGFLGAIDNVFDRFSNKFEMKKYEFKTNYRFKENDKMNKLDKFIRYYGENYSIPEFEAELSVVIKESEKNENYFILEGVKLFNKDKKGKLALLVKQRKLANEILTCFNENGINYFNALFNDNDLEYIKFHEKALELLNSANNYSKKVTKKVVRLVIDKITEWRSELEEKSDESYKNLYIVDSLIVLLKLLFSKTLTDSGSSLEKYEKIRFILEINNLKSMIEYVNESIIITTIHSSKGLEWDYVIIPRLNEYIFSPNCKTCKEAMSKKNYQKSCEFLFKEEMKKNFKEELSVFYVALTRARRNIFITANNNKNIFGYLTRTSCFLNLKGLNCNEYKWNDFFN
ncbi:DNA helicase II [Clostridium perfringens]|uniref:ATP-dependent helicase n=1 Tax=Clostridium perfringens TaxID=1502 RepID=UPI002443D9D3|nr:ATP-dependent helicase [Clostridium perfringens]EJT5939211.1 ATP-dependent helicase [Clostridium perfringens]EJT6471150.1 ATP-dependent helicase [Clostridium perfringens]MDG6880067.1 DNA helicase II [Clostridium perfringens]